MKILCVTYEYPPVGGGGANVAHPLAAALAQRGHQLDVVTSGMRDLLAEETRDGVAIHRTPCLRRHRHYTTTPELLTWLWPAYRKSLELVDRRDFDINHTHFALPSGVVSWLLYRRTGLPYVITIHGSDVPGYNPDRFHVAHALASPLWRRVIRSAAMIISASQFLKELLQSRMNVPVEIVRNGFDGASSGLSPGVKRNRILVVTRMFRRKGIQHFIEALEGVVHDWEVVIAGDGPYLPVLKEQVRRTGLNVEFVGFVQGRVLADLYGTSRIFVFPSSQENFPTVLLEAMQAGCAIITTNADGCGEVLGDAGIAVAPERPDQIRAALVELIADPAKTEKLGVLARERVRRFRWPRIAARYEAVMNEALGNSAGPAIDESVTVDTLRRR